MAGLMINFFKVRDPGLFLLAMLATLIGFLVVFDAGFARSLQTQRGIVPREFWTQLAFFVPALFLSFGASSIDQDRWLKISKVLWLLTLLLLVAVTLSGLRYEVNGGDRLFTVGVIIDQAV